VLAQVLLSAITAGLWWRLRRTPDLVLGLLHGLLLVALGGVIGAAGTRWGGATFFAPAGIVAWALLLYVPLLWLGAAAAWGRRAPRQAIALGLAGAFGAGVGVDARVVEPRWLDVVHHTVQTDGVAGRVVLVADLQTDAVGPWEARVFEEIRAQSPDLVLFAGDYVQLYQAEPYARELARLRALVATLDPPWGGFAVSGDIDPPLVWKAAFDGTAITPLDDDSVRAGPVVVSGLAVGTSHRGPLPDAPDGAFHIVLGHSPDFSLEDTGADLLLAGHTHGGQVVIPGFGPPVTFAKVQRAQGAGGAFPRPDGSTLVVSRGIGMERVDAPRVRFFCRPELTVIDLVPR